MANRIQHRRDTAANWTAANPILALGEPAIETDTKKRKVGDGVTAWTSLGYEALNPKSRTMAANDRIMYQPSSTAALRWRTTRAQILNGQRQGHIAVLADSIGFGTGSAIPKFDNSHPGQLRKLLDNRYGSAGTGIVMFNNDLKANPTWDSRMNISANVTAQAWGLHEYGMFNIPAQTDYVEFTAVADEFYVYCIGSPTLSVDGGTATVQVSGNKLAGYTSNHQVFKVTTGSTASHTIKIAGNPGGAMQIFGVEARVLGNGRWRVSNQSIAGKSLASLFANNTSGETSGLRGLPFIDSIKADLLLIGLGINDWQGSTATATVKSNLTQVIQRQRASGNNSMSGPKPAGEAVLLWNPSPDIRDVPTGLQPVGGPSWAAYRDAFYEVANEQDCALIDLGDFWKDYTTGSATFGLFADRIHPNDKGAGDEAGAIHRALFQEV